MISVIKEGYSSFLWEDIRQGEYLNHFLWCECRVTLLTLIKSISMRAEGTMDGWRGRSGKKMPRGEEEAVVELTKLKRADPEVRRRMDPWKEAGDWI